MSVCPQAEKTYFSECNIFDYYASPIGWGMMHWCNAVASLDEAEGPQHMAGGHGVDGCDKMSPLPPRGDPGVFDILNTKSCILMHSLALKIGTASAFIEIPKH